jgi:hypothetical protein
MVEYSGPPSAWGCETEPESVICRQLSGTGTQTGPAAFRGSPAAHGAAANFSEIRRPIFCLAVGSGLFGAASRGEPESVKAPVRRFPGNNAAKPEPSETGHAKEPTWVRVKNMEELDTAAGRLSRTGLAQPTAPRRRWPTARTVPRPSSRPAPLFQNNRPASAAVFSGSAEPGHRSTYS